VFFVASLWWQEWRQAGELQLGISINKASSFPIRADRHAAGWTASTFFFELPRRKMEEMICRLGSFNKRWLLSIWSAGGALLLLSCRGGLEEEQQDARRSTLQILGRVGMSHSFIWGCIHSSAASAIILHGRKATTPSSAAGFGSFRSMIDGVQQPPGYHAKKEAPLL